MADTDLPSLPHLAGDSHKMDPSPAHPPHYENLPHTSCDYQWSFLHTIGITYLQAPRDAMRKCSLLSSGVRLSVTLVDCIHTAEDVVKLLVRPVAPSIVF